LQLRVTLDHVPVPVPRQLLVRSDLAFGRLHDVLRGAMGWEDTHMHEFEVGERRIGVGQGDALFADESPADDECKTTLGAALAGVKAFRDCYDFGDDWWRTIQIEAVPPLEGDVPGAELVEGAGACPPEDPGGPFRCAELLAIKRQSRNPQRAELIECYGTLDTIAFDPGRRRKRLPRRAKGKRRR
jgi:hypothetical protein